VVGEAVVVVVVELLVEISEETVPLEEMIAGCCFFPPLAVTLDKIFDEGSC